MLSLAVPRGSLRIHEHLPDVRGLQTICGHARPNEVAKFEDLAENADKYLVCGYSRLQQGVTVFAPVSFAIYDMYSSKTVQVCSLSFGVICVDCSVFLSI